MVQVSDAVKSRIPRGPRVVLVATLACWALGALVFAALAPGSAGRYVAAIAIYYAASVLVLVAVARAIWTARGGQRLFWSLLGAGLVAGFAGDMGWSSLQGPGFAAQDLSYQHVAYLISYLLLAGALLRLVASTTKRITLITALDSISIMLSGGTLIWYFFLGRVVEQTGSEGSWAVLAVLSWPLFDAALLFLGLVVLSAAGKPPFAGLLAAGFLAFVVADGMYLGAHSGNSYENAGWPDVFWALGLVFFGLAALKAAPASVSAQRIEPWRIFAFWLGPLSPAVHLAVVLFWSAAHPPLPAYVAVSGALLFLYLALRVSLVSFVSRRLGREREEATRQLEQGRVLSELHDTVKQGVHGVSLTLKVAVEAARRGDRDAALGMLDQALKASRETEFQVSRPYDELQTTIHGEDALRPKEYLRHRLVRFEEYFGIKTHEDLQASLEVLSPIELAAVYRIVVEAFWNVAKHSGARNMYLESRRVGDLLLLRVRDDGRGFDPADPPPGMGLRYVRQRAGEVGAGLDVISGPGRGTTVQLRFRTRRHPAGARPADA
jgi:signal transduction histidine kinase